MPVNDRDDWYHINIYSTILLLLYYNINANGTQDKKDKFSQSWTRDFFSFFFFKHKEHNNIT